MAQITPSLPTLAGTLMTPNNASGGGDSIANPRSDVYLMVINGGGGSINCTIAAQVTPRPADGTFPAMTLANQVVAVGAGATRLIGPIPAAYNDGNGNVQVSWSGTASVTFHAFRRPD